MNIPLCMPFGSLMEGVEGEEKTKKKGLRRHPHFYCSRGLSVTKWSLLVTTDTLI